MIFTFLTKVTVFLFIILRNYACPTNERVSRDLISKPFFIYINDHI